ncbi:MAG: thioredoxin family protein [Tenericutes bacterium]|nr:thioredoxin family protein [Mycoplasmatota bacterium]
MENYKVLFFMARYCGKCFAIKNRVNRLVEDNMFNIKYEFIDIELRNDLVNKFVVNGVPTTIILKDNKEVQRISGSLYNEDLLKLTK